MTSRDHAEVYRDEAGEWRARVVAANGNILLSTEGYTRKIDAVDIVKSRFGPIPIEYLEDSPPE